MLAPTIEKLAGEYDGKVKVGKMNTDENMDTPGSLRISAIPTVLVFHQGQRGQPAGRRESRDKVQGLTGQARECRDPRDSSLEKDIDELASPLFDFESRKNLRVSESTVLVKICGLTCVEDARGLREAGADWIGLNFHPPSVRYVHARSRSGHYRRTPGSVAVAGVFVDRPAAEVAYVGRRLGLGIVQLHGREPPEDLVVLEHLRVSSGRASGGRQPPVLEGRRSPDRGLTPRAGRTGPFGNRLSA